MKDLAFEVYQKFLMQSETVGLMLVKQVNQVMWDHMFVENKPLPMKALFPRQFYSPVGANCLLDRTVMGKANTLRDTLEVMFLIFDDDEISLELIAPNQTSMEVQGIFSELTIPRSFFVDNNIKLKDIVGTKWKILRKGASRIAEEKKSFLNSEEDSLKLEEYLVSSERVSQRLNKLSVKRRGERLSLVRTTGGKYESKAKDLLKLEAEVFALGKENLSNVEVQKADYEAKRASLLDLLAWVNLNEDSFIE